MDKTWVELSDDGKKVEVEIYPIIIIPTRYGGVYEGALWACFPAEKVPEWATGSDDECSMWWEAMGNFVGLGHSPNSSYLNLNTLPDKFSEAQEKFEKEVEEEYWEGVNGRT